jgi:hypothetical protein
MSNETEDKRRVFYSPAKATTIDLIREDGLSQVNGRTIEELRAEYPDVMSLSIDEAYARTEAYHRRAPWRITGERWDYMLGVLPPVNWRSGEGGESFMLSERTCGSITAICYREGNEFWEMQDSTRTPHAKIVRMVRDRRAELLSESGGELLEALRQAQAALPDAWFAVKCDVPREVVDLIERTIRKAEGWQS